jgi:hypothetical protein
VYRNVVFLWRTTILRKKSVRGTNVYVEDVEHRWRSCAGVPKLRAHQGVKANPRMMRPSCHTGTSTRHQQWMELVEESRETRAHRT